MNNGKHYSAPGFVTYYGLDNQKRVYDDKKNLEAGIVPLDLPRPNVVSCFPAVTSIPVDAGLSGVVWSSSPHITSTLFFEYQTIDALVSHLLETREETLITLVGVDAHGQRQVDDGGSRSDGPGSLSPRERPARSDG